MGPAQTRRVALKTWLWNLGAVGVAAGVGGCAAEEIAEPNTQETDTDVDTWSVETDAPPDPTVPNDTDYNNDTDYYYDTDYDYEPEPPECTDDDDCELGTCEFAGEPWARCEALPIPMWCGDVPELQTAWVREGEGAGRAAGMPDAERVVLVDAVVEEEVVPVSIVSTEAGATPEPLAVELLEGESVVGVAGGDLDGDGEPELLLSVRDDARLRVVVLAEDDQGQLTESAEVVFEEIGDPAQLRRYEDGTADLLVRLDSGALLEATGLGDGTFAEPVPAMWPMTSVASFATGALDNGGNEDLVVLGSVDGSGVIEVQLDSGLLPVGSTGSLERSLHMDAIGARILAVEETEGGVAVQSLELGAFVDPDSTLVPPTNSPVIESTVADFDGDGRSDVVLLLEDGRLHVMFGASAQEPCRERIETGGVFESIHRAGSGREAGVVLSGPDGVLAIRGVAR